MRFLKNKTIFTFYISSGLILLNFCSITIKEVRQKYPDFERFRTSCSSSDFLNKISNNYINYGKYRTSKSVDISWEDNGYLIQFEYKDREGIKIYTLKIDNNRDMKEFMNFCPDIVKEYINKIPYATEELSKYIDLEKKEKRPECDNLLGKISCGNSNNTYLVSKLNDKYVLYLEKYNTSNFYVCEDNKLKRDINDTTFIEMTSFFPLNEKEKIRENPGTYILQKKEKYYMNHMTHIRR